jgi:peptidoglycan/xylan/chitin deacetylase (PgdA/CDA1 family)
MLTGKTQLESAAGIVRFKTQSDRWKASRRLNQWVKSLRHEAAMGFVDQTCAALEAPEAPSDVLSWRQLRCLAGQGLSLAPHTATHPLLHRLPPEQAGAEAVASHRRLEQEIGAAPRVFAYPGGGHNAEVVEVLRQARFELAFTTRRGGNRLAAADPLRLRRINISRGTSRDYLRLQLLASSLVANSRT